MTQEIPQEPTLLRTFIKNLRNRLSLEERSKIFQAIFARFVSSSFYQNAHHLLAYAGKVSAGEFNTEPLLKQILVEKKFLALPKVQQNPFGLSLYKVSDIASDLSLGNFQLLEPIPERCQQVNFDQIDLAIIPGMVFDRNGTRYGYGLGYYDRLLSVPSHKKLIKVALAYSMTVMQFLLQKNSWDISMDIIITEHEIIDCRLKNKK